MRKKVCIYRRHWISWRLQIVYMYICIYIFFNFFFLLLLLSKNHLNKILFFFLNCWNIFFKCSPPGYTGYSSKHVKDFVRKSYIIFFNSIPTNIATWGKGMTHSLYTLDPKYVYRFWESFRKAVRLSLCFALIALATYQLAPVSRSPERRWSTSYATSGMSQAHAEAAEEAGRHSWPSQLAVCCKCHSCTCEEPLQEDA